MVDSIDVKIIGELKKNSRASFVAIGRKIALFSSAVQERIQKLADLDVIKSYNVQIDHSMMGKGGGFYTAENL